MPPTQGQDRKIEKKGIVIFTEQELLAQYLRVDCNVLQYPYNLSKNYRYNPDVAWFGNYVLMSHGYAVKGENISFESQRLFENWRNVEQSAENIISKVLTAMDMLESISLRVAVPLSFLPFATDDDTVVACSVTGIKFVLPEGCVIQVFTTYFPFEQRFNSLTTHEPPTPPPASPPSSPPIPPPPKGQPPTTSPPGGGGIIEISPPYNENTKDGGDTYVPPRYTPPDVPGGKTVGVQYRVSISSQQPAFPDNPPQTMDYVVTGPVLGLGSQSGGDEGWFGLFSGNEHFDQIARNFRVVGKSANTAWDASIYKITSIVRQDGTLE